MRDGRRSGAGHPAGALLNVARTGLDPRLTLASDRTSNSQFNSLCDRIERKQLLRARDAA
jgi:hypothetical protein